MTELTFDDVDRNWSPYFRRRRFFTHALGWLLSEGRNDAYWEFGVGIGSLSDFYSACGDVTRPIEVVGFDTFSGLPATSHSADQHPHWQAGKLATSMDDVLKMAAHFEACPTLIAGDFAETLTADLRASLPPPMLITIDCDYYTSTKVVLDFLAPVLTPGTLLYFDDIWAFHGDPSKGQLRALREFDERPLTPHWLGVGSQQVYVVSA